ncbi:hypothetical protein AAHC03_09287 [Spirometra sp. Aus1]
MRTKRNRLLLSWNLGGKHGWPPAGLNAGGGCSVLTQGSQTRIISDGKELCLRIVFMKKKMNFVLAVLSVAIFSYWFLIVDEDEPLCQNNHESKNSALQHTVTDNHLRVLSSLLVDVNFSSILERINLVRPVGSENHHTVREYITSFLRELGWHVSEDAFQEWTVLGVQNFTNIIAINQFDLPRRLALACHYDSKRINGFYGTTDSAVPCSMMLVIAKALNPLLKSSKVALQLLFFDGEEAFISWSPDDSIYGSRHLAAQMLQSTSGAANTQFPRYPHCDESIYRMMIDIESTAARANLLTEPRFTNSGASFFYNITMNGIEDDHLPFIRRGVPVLHLIPLPFPPQWHTLRDNIENVDMRTVRDLQLLVAGFVSRYLVLNPVA